MKHYPYGNKISPYVDILSQCLEYVVLTTALGTPKIYGAHQMLGVTVVISRVAVYCVGILFLQIAWSHCECS